MGCASSKRIEATLDVYRPAPSSFAIFDINAIQEPWLKLDAAPNHNPHKPSHLPPPILEKLSTFESDVPHSWDEVSKALQDLKPSLHNPAPPPSNPSPSPSPIPVQPTPMAAPPPPPQDGGAASGKLRTSIHTLEELDAKLSPKPKELRKTQSMRAELKKGESVAPPPPAESQGYKPVRENIFVVRDRLERGKEGKAGVKVDPLSEYPEKCPPGGSESLVLYTTSLGGVRRTYEDCNRVRSILERHRVVVDERDVSLHGEFLKELREMVGEEASVPRVFLKGRYVGGVEEVVGLNETGRLGRLMNWARLDRGVGRLGCEGCGGARFVPCLDCGGSCKVVVGDAKGRCSKCNENGLVHCPTCL